MNGRAGFYRDGVCGRQNGDGDGFWLSQAQSEKDHDQRVYDDETSDLCVSLTSEEKTRSER